MDTQTKETIKEIVASAIKPLEDKIIELEKTINDLKSKREFKRIEG